MRDNTTGIRRSGKTGETGRGDEQSRTAAKKPVVRPGLGRAQRKLYQELYRRAYVRRHGGGKTGKDALRELQRQQKRSSRGVYYLPLLFETEDGRYRLWTWEGPSKLVLKSAGEAEGMRDLFFPRERPTVISHAADVNRHLRSACKAVASGVSIQALTHHERRAYAFLLWNEARRYEYMSALAADQDPLASNANFRLASLLLVEALVRPLDFVRFLVDRVRPVVSELTEERGASGEPLERDHPADHVILEFKAALDAAHAYLVASGLKTEITAAAIDHRVWFRRQARRSERSEPTLRGEPAVAPFQMPVEVEVGGRTSAAATVPMAPPRSGQATAREHPVKNSGHKGGKADGKRKG